MSDNLSTPKLTSVNFGFGGVRLIAKVDAIPKTTKIKGNVTTHNAGSPEIPSYYEVNHFLSCKFGEGTSSFSNHFSLKVHLYDIQKGASYSKIEAEAARQLAPMLQAVSQEIEKMVSEYDQKEKIEGMDALPD